MWLGLASFEMALVYVLCILAAIWCVVYGLYFFTQKEVADDVKDMATWEEHEREMDKQTP
jgi:uncharacterized membrane protein YuzA (DUF378 family)